MGDELRQKFEPRKAKHNADVPGFDDEACWANTLDWHNEYDFYRLKILVIERLDSDYREKVGIRVDQLATEEEIDNMFRTCRNLYQEDPVIQAQGIYVFLHTNMNLWLGGKAAWRDRSVRLNFCAHGA